ncbi:MAG: Hok/Gef family protein [Bacteroidota bacterium]
MANSSIDHSHGANRGTMARRVGALSVSFRIAAILMCLGMLTFARIVRPSLCLLRIASVRPISGC